MMHSPHNIAEPRRFKTVGHSPLEIRPDDGADFGEWIAPLRVDADNSAASIQATSAAGNASSIRQGNGAPSKIEHEQTKLDASTNGSTDADPDQDKTGDNPYDNSILASIMASCTSREKPKIYTDCEQAGLPLRELDRMARALHDSALAGRPKLSLGIVLPELGEIRFDVQIAGKVVFIHAFVENERAASALALAVSALRDRLEEQRLILGRLDVTSPGGKNPAGRVPGERPISGHRPNHGDAERSPGIERSDEEGIYVLA